MSDAHLSDHEWKLKMAAEGKASYIPGKTEEQARAEQNAEAKHLAQTSARTVSLTNSDWRIIDTAISDLMELLHDFEDMLSMLGYADNLDGGDVRSTLRMVAKVIKGVMGKEMQTLDRLDDALRRAPRGEKS